MSTNQPQPSDTPRTDSQPIFWLCGDPKHGRIECVDKTFARTLERENAAQAAEIEVWKSVAAQISAERDHNANVVGEQAKRIAELEADKRRLDWLADKTNDVGQVLLPSDCVNAHLDDMRAAIDAAMGQHGDAKKKGTQ